MFTKPKELAGQGVPPADGKEQVTRREVLKLGALFTASFTGIGDVVKKLFGGYQTVERWANGREHSSIDIYPISEEELLKAGPPVPDALLRIFSLSTERRKSVKTLNMLRKITTVFQNRYFDRFKDDSNISIDVPDAELSVFLREILQEFRDIFPDDAFDSAQFRVIDQSIIDNGGLILEHMVPYLIEAMYASIRETRPSLIREIPTMPSLVAGVKSPSDIIRLLPEIQTDFGTQDSIQKLLDVIRDADDVRVKNKSRWISVSSGTEIIRRMASKTATDITAFDAGTVIIQPAAQAMSERVFTILDRHVVQGEVKFLLIGAGKDNWGSDAKQSQSQTGRIQFTIFTEQELIDTLSATSMKQYFTIAPYAQVA